LKTIQFSFTPVLGAVLALLGSLPAQGTIIFSTGDPPATASTIQFNDPGAVTAGFTVSGFPSFSTEAWTLFDFTGLELLNTPASGASRVEADDGGFTSLQLQAHEAVFEGISFNLQLVTNTLSDGLTVEVTTLSGATFFHDYGSNVLGNGANRFYIFTDSPLTEFIRTVQINTTTELADVRQIALVGLVPEPSSLVLIGAGLALLAFKSRHSLRRHMDRSVQPDNRSV